MSVVILTDRVQRLECFYCTTTDHAFGPVMFPGEGEAFLDWLKEAGTEYGRIKQPALIGDGTDPRDYALDHLEEIYHQFRREQEGAEPDNLRYLGDGRWGATSR
jgi:hypothetical protein